MTYKELQLNKIYKYKRFYYIIIEKNENYFFYYEYNSYNNRWFHGKDIFNKYNVVWGNLELEKINNKLRYKMIKDLFKNGINNDI